MMTHKLMQVHSADKTADGKIQIISLYRGLEQLFQTKVSKIMILSCLVIISTMSLCVQKLRKEDETSHKFIFKIILGWEKYYNFWWPTQNLYESMVHVRII